MDGGDFLDALTLIGTVVNPLRPACCFQRLVDTGGSRRPPFFGVAPVIPIGGVLPMTFPSAFAVRNALTMLVQVVNLPALRPPSPICFQWPHGEHDMGVRIATANNMTLKEISLY